MTASSPRPRAPETESAALRDALQRLNLALAAGQLGDWSWDAATDLVTLSDRAADIFALPRGEKVTWTAMRDLLHPDDRERARVAVERAIADRTTYSIEYRVVRPDARVVWIAAKGNAVYDGDAATGMIGIVQDVTERRANDETLRRLLEEAQRSAEERKDLLEAAALLNRIGSTLSSELDEERLIQTITDEATRVTGAQFGAYFRNVTNEKGESYLLYTLSGASRDAFSKFPVPRNTQVFAPTFAGTGVVRSDDIKKDPRYGHNPPHFGMPKGHLPVSSYLAVPVRSGGGDVLGGLFFGHEKPGMFKERHEQLVVGIAAQASIALDNARLYRAAKDADRRKDEFLAMLAHELRNPLTPMLMALHMLRTSDDPGVTRRAREVMERQMDRVVRLVDDLLDISRITRGKIQLRTVRLDLRNVVERALAASHHALDSRQHALELQLPANELLVDGDGMRLEQILTNLLSNAAKYTPRGGRVRVSASVESGRARVSVADDGIGIAPEFLPRVFDLFAQSEKSIDRADGGLGVGLTLAQNLAALHGGAIEARSEGLGKGAEFVLRLPLASGVEPSTETPVVREEMQERSLAIVIIEDADDIATTTSEYLELRGHVVRRARSGAEGVELVRSMRPDVVILDLGLPGMNGYEVAQRLRRDPETANVGLVVMSGYAQESDRARSRAAGVDLHLAKPVEPADLVEALRKCSYRTA